VTDLANTTFESAIAELESLVQKLERNDGTLDDSIATFRRATELAEMCRTQLETARLRITELMPAPEPDVIDEDSDDVPF
jgi:exodeoxyribonuclease VII small subunit